jgi:hypothetical protein
MQGCEVLGDPLARDRQPPRKLRLRERAVAREQLRDLAPRRVGERGEDRARLIVGPAQA